VPIPYAELKELIENERLASGVATRSRLWQKAPEILTGIWKHVQSECERRGVILQIMLMPRVDDLPQDGASFAQLADVAKRIGLPVMDLTKVYGEGDHSNLRIAAWDDHPNVAGHRLLAEELYRQMRLAPAWQTALGLDQPAQAVLMDTRVRAELNDSNFGIHSRSANDVR
jgi:hypothetical protein